MTTKYTPKELHKLYEKLPQELKDTLFSTDTADNIWRSCERNSVNEVAKVADLVGNVLLGILAPNNFQEALENELGLKKDVAEKVSQEINRFIFYPVKPALEELYGAKIEEPKGKIEKIKEVGTETGPKESSEPPRHDTYRETVE